ncbi:alpha/beta hydrolase domain-containing protein [Daedaleopsis nitida]|nr:alpha/beta hydrolase domain-containing protein [Daedaleopsis nitida]
MEVVGALPDNEIFSVLGPTLEAFKPLLEKRRAEIEGSPRRTFQYGSTDRHQLDVYYPDPKAIPDGKIPVLFFEYGGGFVMGDRKLQPPYDLGYTNLGVFFAQHGILTVIADYRLAPAAKFPQPVEDIRDALAWFLTNPSTVLAACPAGPYDLTKVGLGKLFVMGHSAGANHVMSLFLSPTVLPPTSPIRAATRGLIPKGGAYRFKFPDTDLQPGALESYYGSEEVTLENMPYALLERADQTLLDGLPEMFVLRSEREPEGIRQMNEDFVKALEDRGKTVRYELMKGHNHISPHWALLSGEGEEWGRLSPSGSRREFEILDQELAVMYDIYMDQKSIVTAF